MTDRLARQTAYDSSGSSVVGYRLEDAIVVGTIVGPDGSRATVTFKIGPDGDLRLTSEVDSIAAYSSGWSLTVPTTTTPRYSVELAGELVPDRDGVSYMIELERP